MTPADTKPQQAAVISKLSDESPTQEEFGQLVAALARMGIRGQELVTAIHVAKTRRQNAETLKKWLKTRPRKGV